MFIVGPRQGAYPVTGFFAELPAHSKLLADFDLQPAKVPVPPQATTQAAAFNAYIRFTNAFDAKRRPQRGWSRARATYLGH
jgi:hypothetical protein